MLLLKRTNGLESREDFAVEISAQWFVCCDKISPIVVKRFNYCREVTFSPVSDSSSSRSTCGDIRCVHSLLQRSCSTDVSITYLPQLNATHCSKVKINLTLLQYRNAVVGAETAFRALQLTATQLQWTMNAS